MVGCNAYCLVCEQHFQVIALTNQLTIKLGLIDLLFLLNVFDEISDCTLGIIGKISLLKLRYISVSYIL